MTGARQPGKPRRYGLFAAFALSAVILTHSGPAPATEPGVTVDVNSGLALSGVDPVAYFTDGRPVFGRAEFELSALGAVWRFRNVGNRTAFLENPEIYRPQFDGYDPVALIRGRAVAGHPMIWAVTGERLYLFYDEADRAAFMAEPERMIETARRKWPDVARTLGR